MAFKLTAKTKSILKQIEKNPTALFDIEGVENIFSSSVVLEKIKWDTDGLTWDQNGLSWDGSVKLDRAKSYINLKECTRAITQQIYPDKEGVSSITSVQASIVDYNGEVAKILSNENVGEILGKKCLFSLGFVGANYSEDFLPVMNSIIVDYSYQAGAIKLTLSHADTLRRQKMLTEYGAELTASINSTQTTILVNKTEGLLESQDILKSFVQCEDEIMELVSIDSDTQLTVVRGQLNTIEDSHDSTTEINSVYQLKDFPLPMAQKIMQSDGNQSFFESDITAISFQFVSPVQEINNAIIFNDIDIERNTGLIENDIVEIDGYGQYTVDSFGKLDVGYSYIRVKEELSTDPNLIGTWRFKSQFNVLNFGLGMQPFQVDNFEFEYIKSIFTPNFTEMTFTLSEGIDNARDFINKELYFVSGCYGVPRNARSSIKFLSPPLSTEELPILNEKTVNNMVKLKPERSINKFYYNDILYAFGKSIKDGKFKSFTEFIDADSFSDFGVGKKQLRIESLGLQRDSQTDLIVSRLARRFLDRYKKAAILIKGVELSYRYGFNLQVGDVVIFGGEGTKLVEYETGKRNLGVAKYEIINQTIDLSGKITIDILSTNFAIAGTFGVISPSSKIAAGSTKTKLVLSKISNLDEFDFERDKYESWIGLKINIRSEDYTFSEVVTLEGFNTQDPYAVDISELSIVPSEGFIVELADYDEYDAYGTNDQTDALKLKYTFAMPKVDVVSGASGTVFDVDDASKLFIGQSIAVHSNDFTNDNLNNTILDITGTTITVENDLGFTPASGDYVETLSWVDLDGYLIL